MTPVMQILLAGLPYAPALIEDIVAAFKTLFSKYPAMTSAQILAIVAATSQQADQGFIAELAKIAADQAAVAAPAAKVA